MMVNVISDVLWIMGVSGAVATISYMYWLRTLEYRSWRFLLSTPQFLFPLCLSSTLTCAGAAIGGRSSVLPVAWYETLVWAALAAVFAYWSVECYLAGHKNGWKTSTEGMSWP
jgi:hypothetical protein